MIKEIADIINTEPLPTEGKKWEYSQSLAKEIIQLLLSSLPAVPRCICGSTTRKIWGCSCGAKAIKEYKSELMRILK